MAIFQNRLRFLSEHNINPSVKKIQNYRKKWMKHIRGMDRERERERESERQTATLNYEILTKCEMKPRTTLTSHVA